GWGMGACRGVGRLRGGWPCAPRRRRRPRRSSAGLEPTALEPPGLCAACVPPARLRLACTSAADSCWVLTPSERAAAANTGDEVSALPAANSGRNAALTRAVLTCSCWATAAVIASWTRRSSAGVEPAGFLLADMACGWVPGLVSVADATAAPVPPAARAAVAAAAAISLARLRMRILLGLWLAPKEPGGTQAGPRNSLSRPKKAAPPPDLATS